MKFTFVAFTPIFNENDPLDFLTNILVALSSFDPRTVKQVLRASAPTERGQITCYAHDFFGSRCLLSTQETDTLFADANSGPPPTYPTLPICQ
jgi:hypothetical protein